MKSHFLSYLCDINKSGSLAQLVRAPSLYLGGRWFKPNRNYQILLKTITNNMKKIISVDCSVAGTRELVLALVKAKSTPIYNDGIWDIWEFPHLTWSNGRIQGITTRGLNEPYRNKVPLSEFIKFIEEYQPPLMLGGHKVEFDKEGIIKVGCNTFKKAEVDKFISEYNKFFNH